MDIRFGSTSQASSDAKADSNSEDHGTDSSDPESSPSPPPSKKVCKSSKNKRYHSSVSSGGFRGGSMGAVAPPFSG